MYYVYIIQSINFPEQVYIGCTQDFVKRLSNHNCGTTSHTQKYMPWKLVTYSVFEDKDVAYKYEEYLKSGSGRAFAKKRFW
ncbi:GIY-YIG nuclease family protein [Candidatus Dependentiae bacterium]|nr:GIY-YIG nuclease family protein [Candidatus Dependentiae bacterium]